jgi:nucleoside-diphosphate-sugar epimerase
MNSKASDRAYWAMAKRVLVTGASGFVGQHLVMALQDAGYQVVGLSRQQGEIAQCRLDYEDIDYVFHLAARTFVPDSWNNARGFYETNVIGTVNVLEFCRRRSCPLAVVSSYVYGHPRYLPIDERHPVEGFNPYAHSKILAEEAIRYYSQQFELTAAVIRPFNLYGDGQDKRFLIPTILEQAVGDCDAIRVADLRPKRDFLHVRDLVALLMIVAGRRASGIYNAGSGISTSIAQLVGYINETLPQPKEVLSSTQVRENEVLETVADCSKAAAELGWSARTPIAEGIRQLARETLANRIDVGRP